MKPSTTILCAALIAATTAAQAQPLVGKAGASAQIARLVVEAKKSEAASVVVRVVPLHDAGGLSAVSASGDTINVSYTQAIRRYLADVGYTVVDKAPRGVSPAYSVEGDLSHLSIDDAGSGPYLCVLRLFDETSQHKLVGQWAGVAQNLRDLTANFNETQGVDSEGLLGEMGGKIAETIRAASDTNGAATFAAVVDVASDPDLIDAFPVEATPPSIPAARSILGPAEGATSSLSTVVPTKIGQPEPPTPDQLASGEAYRLQVRSTETGNVVLIALGPSGEPLTVTSDDDSYVPVLADKPIVVPASTPLTAPTVTSPTDIKIVVLEHVSASAPATTGIAVDDDLPARVLLGTTPPASPPVKDVAVTRLLRNILADPPHTWIAHVVTLHIVPKG